MPRRSRAEFEAEELSDASYEGTPDAVAIDAEDVDKTADEGVEVDLQVVVNQVIRLVMAKELRGSLIRREHITQAAASLNSTRKFSYEKIYTQVKTELESIYGLTLVETPRLNSKLTKQPLILVSVLEDKSKKILGEILSQSNDLPRGRPNKLRISENDLKMSGITAAVLSVVILNENNVTEHELFNSLSKFGISASETERIDQIKMTSPELLGSLLKKDYLVKENMNDSKSREQSALRVYYKLGRRAIMEFTPIAMVKFAHALYGTEFLEHIADQLITVLEKAYDFEISERPDIAKIVDDLKPKARDTEINEENGRDQTDD